MARHLLVSLLCAPVLLACSSLPELESPGPSLTAWGGMMSLGGEMKMESPANPPQQNPYQDVSADFGLDDRDFGIGGTAAWGDGFGGIELSYFGWKSARPSQPASPEADFGNIRAGSVVESEVELQQISIEWIQTLVRTNKLAKNLTVRLGAGLSIDHNEYQINIKELGGVSGPLQNQTLNMRDSFGIPMLQLRAEGEIRPFRLRFDLGYMQGDFGDFDGNFIDFAATAWWEAQKGIDLFVGAWVYALPTSGTEAGLAYTLDTNMSGFTFGIRFEL